MGLSKIIVVDDEEALASFLAKLLQQESPDYNVRVAYNGQDAMKMLEGFAPDCILQDIKLPDMSGIEILRAAKAIDPDIQVIMMTAFASLETSLEAIKMGAYDYVVKPFKSEQIKTIVRNALSKRQLLVENKALLQELKEVNRELALTNEKLKVAKAQVDKELERKIEILSELWTISSDLSEELNFEKLTAGVIKGAGKLFGVKDISLLFYEDGNMVVRFVEGFDGFLEVGTKLDPSHPFLKNLQENRKPEVMLYEKGDIKEVAIGALKTKKASPIGVLMIARRDKSETLKRDISLFETYMNTVSIALQNAILFESLERSYVESLLALVKAEEAKDPVIKGHAARVANMVSRVGEKRGLSERELKNLRYAALLHDIGKIGIREYILEKPGELSSEEFEKMKAHIWIGLEILKPIKFMAEAIPIIKSHHENYDGTGYPEALKGKDIPLGARVLSVCDVYDAVTSERAYSGRMTKEQAINLIKEESGKKFDPEVVKAFLEVVGNA